MFIENLPNKGSLLSEFGARKPTHMIGTYPFPQHVMLPPPPGGVTQGTMILSMSLHFRITWMEIPCDAVIP